MSSFSSAGSSIIIFSSSGCSSPVSSSRIFCTGGISFTIWIFSSTETSSVSSVASTVSAGISSIVISGYSISGIVSCCTECSVWTFVSEAGFSASSSITFNGVSSSPVSFSSSLGCCSSSISISSSSTIKGIFCVCAP